MRITKAHKKYIALRAVSAALKAKKDALRVEENLIAEAIYATLYSPADAVLMYKLPAEFFKSQSTVWVAPVGCGRYSSNRTAFHLVSAKRIAAVDVDYRRPLYDMGELPVLDARIDAHISAVSAVEKAGARLRESITTMLAGINTVKALETEWPEGSTFYSDLFSTPTTSNLPAVRGADVNDLIMTLGEV